MSIRGFYNLPNARRSLCLSAVTKVSAVLLALLALLQASCSSIWTDRNPQIDLAQITHFFVEHRLADNNKVDEAIVAELRSRGFEASAGPLTMMPEDAQAIVSYHDEWAWDFRYYLLELEVHIRSAHREQTLATGLYRQPTPISKSPAQVIRAIFDPIFTPQ